MTTAGPDLRALVTAGLDGATLVLPDEDPSPSPAARSAMRGARFYAGGPDPAVAALLTNDRPSIDMVLGAVASGGRLISLPLPPRATDPKAYGEFIQGACRIHGVERLVARDDIVPLLRSLDLTVVPHSTLTTEALASATGAFELVQFTSGSTGPPKGIALDGVALGANVAAIIERIDPRPGDVSVSWLPLSHDMGLIGTLLTAVAACREDQAGNGTVVILPPERFLRSPRSWMDTISAWGGTFTAAPDFGYRRAVAKRSGGALDLTRLRCAIVGGEIVRADTLRSFAAAYADAGLDETALCPAYGMAELGLAATFTPPDEPWRSEVLDPSALASGCRTGPASQSGRIEIVASGPAIDGYAIATHPDRGRIAPITITASHVGRDAEGHTLANDQGHLHTADEGFLDHDGWLYVCGRHDDNIVARGRNVHAPTVEAAIADAPGIRRGRVTATSIPTGEWIVAAEMTGTSPPTSVRQEIRRAAVATCGAAPDHVVLLGPGQMPMTSSGKRQRHEVRRRWLDGSWDQTDPG